MPATFIVTGAQRGTFIVTGAQRGAPGDLTSGSDADLLGSGDATDGQVLTADGAGNAAWEDAGPAGGYLTLTASGDIGGQRLVVANGTGGVVHADPTNPAHAGRVIGMTLGAAVDGADVQIAVDGEVIESGWAWSAGPVYLGAAGVPTQTPPGTGFLQVIGVATAATKIAIGVHQPINLN